MLYYSYDIYYNYYRFPINLQKHRFKGKGKETRADPSQPTGDITHTPGGTTVGCHYCHTSLQLPSQPYGITALRGPVSDVNKTKFARPRPRPRLQLTKPTPRPRPVLQDEDQDCSSQNQHQDRDPCYKTKTKTAAHKTNTKTETRATRPRPRLQLTKPTPRPRPVLQDKDQTFCITTALKRDSLKPKINKKQAIILQYKLCSVFIQRLRGQDACNYSVSC